MAFDLPAQYVHGAGDHNEIGLVNLEIETASASAGAVLPCRVGVFFKEMSGRADKALGSGQTPVERSCGRVRGAAPRPAASPRDICQPEEEQGPHGTLFCFKIVGVTLVVQLNQRVAFFASTEFHGTARKHFQRHGKHRGSHGFVIDLCAVFGDQTLGFFT
ncbi:hypothetical protein PH7735_02378 [Shimia thalassica]|uniref:Uncharacterized protein n=1 Tax=Shimia thalassica TaxID=1715693 RepID=A0A0P1IA18_9RHOB|nr:hypothetical protein PH7735_02378 [Shimia thalassica]